MNLHTKLSFSRKVSQLEVLLFTKHLATMIKAGIPISDALNALAGNTQSSRFENVLKSVEQSVINGQSLGKALAEHPSTFDEFYVSLIALSEESGSLEENLSFIAQQLTKKYTLQRKIIAASIYPLLVLSVAGIMASFIALFILPQLVGFFESLHVELPLATRILLWLAHSFRDFGILIIASIVLITSGFRFLSKTALLKPSWDSLVLHLPVIGHFVKISQLAQFNRNAGILVKSGLPIARAMEITAKTLHNTSFHTSVLKLGQSLNKGNKMSKTLNEPSYRHFPSICTKIIAVGEQTGNVDDSLLYLADFYEEELDNASKNLTTLLEPALLIGIGLVVGFVALAIISPIYELSGSIRR